MTVRDMERTNTADDKIEACIANLMGLNGRVRGLQLAVEEYGLQAIQVWERMQLIHRLDWEEPETVACGGLKGTVAGASRHYRAQERVCDACRTAQNIANRARPRRYGGGRNGHYVATVDWGRVDRWCGGEWLQLNNREKREVVRRRLADGWTAEQCADDLGVTPKTMRRTIALMRRQSTELSTGA